MIKKYTSMFFLVIIIISCSGFPIQFSPGETPGWPLITETLTPAGGICPQSTCPAPQTTRTESTIVPTENSTQTPGVSQPTETNLSTNTPESTDFPTPTLTPKPTETQTTTPSSTSTNTYTPTFTPSITFTLTQPVKPYALQAGNPLYSQNFAHLEIGCNWMGVAGQVFDSSGKTVSNIVVVANGQLESTPVDLIGLTGANLAYGPGGYEIQLSNKVISSTSSLSIALFDLTGTSLSNPVTFPTYADCSKNLIIINFNQH